MKAHPLFPYFLKKSLAIPTSFFIYFSCFFNDPLPYLFWWLERNLNGTTSALEPAKDLILVHKVELKPKIKAHSSGRMVSNGISVVIVSVHSDKTCLKKFFGNYYYYYYCYFEIIARNYGFQWSPETDFRNETESRKVMVDFKLMLYAGKSSS